MGVSFISIKYFTTLLDSKDSTIIINKPYSFKGD
jgi:hypothetical protein